MYVTISSWRMCVHMFFLPTQCVCALLCAHANMHAGMPAYVRVCGLSLCGSDEYATDITHARRGRVRDKYRVLAVVQCKQLVGLAPEEGIAVLPVEAKMVEAVKMVTGCTANTISVLRRPSPYKALELHVVFYI